MSYIIMAINLHIFIIYSSYYIYMHTYITSYKFYKITAGFIIIRFAVTIYLAKPWRIFKGYIFTRIIKTKEEK